MDALATGGVQSLVQSLIQHYRLLSCLRCRINNYVRPPLEYVVESQYFGFRCPYPHSGDLDCQRLKISYLLAVKRVFYAVVFRLLLLACYSLPFKLCCGALFTHFATLRLELAGARYFPLDWAHDRRQSCLLEPTSCLLHRLAYSCTA